MRKQPEAEIQRAVCRHLTQRGVDGLVWFAVPNQGRREPRSAAILKGLGVKAGVSDLIFCYDGRFYALELKTEKGALSESQDKFVNDCLNVGAWVGVAYGLNDALKILDDWGFLRGISGIRHENEGG